MSPDKKKTGTRALPSPRLVAPAGLEPALTAYEAAVLPIERKSSMMVRLEGFEPATFGLRIRCSSN